MSSPALCISILPFPHGADLPLPSYATQGSAGMDVSAAVDAPVTLLPGERASVPTGFALGLPPGYEAQIRSRSGLALRQGVVVLNGPGTIDSDYRGEVGVLLINLGQEAFVISRGMRIAQMVIAPVCQVTWKPTPALPPAERGAGGFGSTGL
jgi:dUTP pyrophosphatase